MRKDRQRTFQKTHIKWQVKHQPPTDQRLVQSKGSIFSVKIKNQSVDDTSRKIINSKSKKKEAECRKERKGKDTIYFLSVIMILYYI